MANYMDIMIVCFCDEDQAIKEISERLGVDFRLSNPESYIFSAYEARSKSGYEFGFDDTKELITVFREAKFNLPESAALIISDEDDDAYNGVFPY